MIVSSRNRWGPRLALPDVEDAEDARVLVETSAVADEPLGVAGRCNVVAYCVVVRGTAIVAGDRGS